MNSTADASNPLDAPGDIGVPLIILTWVLFGVAFLIVALRIWTRLVYLGSRLALHDWLILCAVVSEIIHSTLLTMAQKYGLGRHIGTLQGPNISKAAHYMHVSESFSIITSYFGRISFAVFLLSVMGKTAKTRRHILFALIIIDTIINVIVAIQTYSQCGSHINALWHPALQKLGYCESPDVETYIGYVQASINSLCDLVLTIIPITIVYKLKMPRSTKLGLGALLTLSSFALIASIAKAIEIQQLAKGPDFTYHFAVLQYCVVLENDIVVIAGSVPMLRALWLKNGSDMSPSAYPRPSGYSGGSYPNSSSRKSTNIITSTITRGNQGSRLSPEDDEEYMLGEVPMGGIKRTMETNVVVADHGHGSPVDSLASPSFK